MEGPNGNKKYMLLARELRETVAAMQNGERLDSETLMCQRYNVSRVTVRQALAVLAREGLVESRQGKGTFVAGPPRRYRPPHCHEICMITYNYLTEIFDQMIDAARAALAAKGYSLTVLRCDESLSDKRRILKAALDRDWDGLLVEGVLSDLPCLNLDLYAEIQRRGMPVVFTDGFHAELDYPYVVINDRETMAGMVDYLARLGHKRIGGVFCDNHYQTKMRFRGYLDGLLRNGLEYRDDRVMFRSIAESGYSFDNVFYAMRKSLLECTAMVCYNDSMARYLEATFLRIGVRVPRQMSITGLDQLPEQHPYPTHLTTATHPARQMAAAAAEMLVTMLDTGRDVPSRVLETTFVEGDSTAAPRPDDEALTGFMP